MGAVFLKLVNMSLAASWLIAAVLLVRLLLKKAPKWLSCVLWALVAVRLVCPISPESALSLVPSAETIPAEIETMTTPAIHSGVPVLNQAVNPVLAQSLAPKPADSANPLQIVIPILSYIWLAGMAALLLYALVSYLRIRRRVSASIPVKGSILACDEVQSPFILGIFKPIIYVPSSMDGATLDYVLKHEAAHLARRDHWWKPLGYLILTVYWFNPLCWLAYVLLCRDIEAACDEKVIRDMDRSSVAAYSQALVDCSFPRRRIAACPLAFGEVGVKQRVQSVLNYKKPAFWLILAAAVACCVVAVCFLTNPVSGLSGKLAVSMDMAVAEHNRSPYTDGHFIATSCDVLRISRSRGKTTVYAWVLYEEFSRGDTEPQLEQGSHMPVAVTFDTSEAGDSSTYPVLEYWQPEDGADYARSIRRKFPFPIWSRAFDNSCIVEQEAACRAQAKAAFIDAPTSPAGVYICEKPGFGGDFHLSLKADGSFTYSVGFLSSYFGVGTWDFDGETVTLSDTGMGEARCIYLTVDGDDLVYRAEGSAKFIHMELEDGTRFHRHYEFAPADRDVVCWFDCLVSDEMIWDGLREINLEEFPGVTFRYRAERLEAVTEQETSPLYYGMPIWSVYFCDLNGDGKRELCSTVSIGSGIVDERIMVADFAAGAVYELSDRGKYDYRLVCRDGALWVEKRGCSQYKVLDAGALALRQVGGGMALTYDSAGAADEAAVHAVFFLQKLDFTAQYIRTNGYVDGAEYPETCLLTSETELRAYIEEKQERYDFDSGFDGSVSFLEAAERYDRAFFEKNDLIVVVLEEGSGSNRHEVSAVKQYHSNLDRVQYFVQPEIRRIVPQVGTADMAEWHILIEVSKTALDESQLLPPKVG